jgi:excisionase family DNA binding protein
MSTSAPAHHDPARPAALINGLIEASPAADRLAYTMDEFCRAVTIGRSLAYAEISAGRLRVVRVGRRTLVPVDAAKAWLDNLPQGVASEPAAPRRARLARAGCDGPTPLGPGILPVGLGIPGSKSNRARPKSRSIRPLRDASASS